MKRLYNLSYYLLELCSKIAIILLVFSALRFLFYVSHASLFPTATFSDILSIFYHALRFDLSAICYINLLLILSYLLPIPLRRHSWYKGVQRLIFVTFNGIAVIFELVDIAYFPFILRRSNGGDLALAGNTTDLLPLFLVEYWYLLLVFVFILLFLWWSFKKITLPVVEKAIPYWSQFLVLFLGASIFFVALRGGTQMRPLMPINAQQYVPDIQLAPLAYPTILSLIFSTQQKFIKEKTYFSDEEVSRLFPIHHKFQADGIVKKKPNIVVIILESFGEEYSKLLSKSKTGYTPFLDSLMSQGLYFEQAFANGLRSTQGIAAISVSLPSLMEDPYLFSAYQNNQINGIGTLLKKEGYTSAFFHGANEGTMEFEGFSNLCGFDYYLDRRAFNNDEFYDGNWGIWDQPFFQYTAATLDTFPEPFYAQLFSLTSHHPYAVESDFELKHPNTIPLYRSILYTDDALRQFFRTARKKDWFDHTLFIITADHSGLSKNKKYQTYPGRYMIPILLYSPNSFLGGRQKGVAQQLDILPTILDYIGSNNSFTSFGKSMLDRAAERYVYMYNSQIYRIIDERFILLFDGEKSIGLFDYKKDITLKKELSSAFPEDKKRLEQQLKLVIQQHHNSIIRNQLGK